MSAVELIEHHIVARVPELTNPSQTVETPLTVRVDPLTGMTARLLTGVKLAPQQRPDLSQLTADPQFCPFCERWLEQATGCFDRQITDEGRIRRGRAAVVPNVMAYSEFSSVGIYDTTRHFIDLDELTPSIVGDLLRALTAYTRGVHNLRPMWSSLNANYLPPSGSSLIHPHAQSAHDDFGTSVGRMLVQRSRAWGGGQGQSFWDSLVKTERDGERWIGERGRISVLTPWAPVGFHEVWAIVAGARDISDLDDRDCTDLGAIMAAVFAAYHGYNLTSFNWALYGGGPEPSDRYDLLLKIVSRANVDPVYRSDVTYFEKLHGEAMIDLPPEAVAAAVRQQLG